MEELVYDYQKNLFTIKELSTKYHIGQDKVRKILKEKGIKTRTNAETRILRLNPNYTLEEIEAIVIDNYLNKGFGQQKSGSQFGLSARAVKTILSKYNIEIRDLNNAIKVANAVYDRSTKYFEKNENFFKKQSSDMAWLLGFLAADGNVSKTSNRIRIELSEVDEEILIKIKELLHLENPIYKRENKRGFKFVSLEWSCKEHKEDLALYGIIPNKTYILLPPLALDKKYYIDYIRGYFDGDGTINLNKNKNGNSLRWGICGASKEMLAWILDVLENDYKIPRVNLHVDTSKEKRFYSFIYSTNSTKLIREILYTDSNMFLKRKKDKFDDLLKSYLIKE